MKFMLDTLNLEEIRKWSTILPLAGVTSNPTIAKKEGGVPFFERLAAIREIIGEAPSLHVQVVAQDYEGILRDAALIQEQAPSNTYIKVPVTPSGLAAIQTLKKEGAAITATAIYTTMQGLLAIEAGADYLAPYYNRMANLNIDSDQVIAQLACAIQENHASSEILAASFKNVEQVNRAFLHGAHAITAGADVFEAAFAMPSIQQAVNDFSADWATIYKKTSL